jgi:hypothetical protein
MGDAGFDRGSDRTVGADARVIEVIDEEYHGVLDAPGIGAQRENAMEDETSQLGNTRKRKKSYRG